MTAIPFFDGHNDVLLRLMQDDGAEACTRFVNGCETGHLDLPRMTTAGFQGGFFAAFAPSPERFDFEDFQSPRGYSVPMPPPLDQKAALQSTTDMLDLLEDIEWASAGRLKICRRMSDIKATQENNTIAAIFHIEGADCIDAEFSALNMLYDRGLRSIGIVWSRDNIFGSGAPFQFPGRPDTGPGLTDLGRALVSECNDRKVLIDLSHLNEKGFWDVAATSRAPLVATHSNAHHLCPSPRNLTDHQIRAVADTGGVIGLNFAPCFLAADGMLNGDVPLDVLLRHLRYIENLAGIDTVALGSDFDGVMMPDEIGDVTGVAKIFDALDMMGLPAASIEEVAKGNWLRVLAETIG